MNTSSQKQNEKVNAGKAKKDNEVLEGTNNTINTEDKDKDVYPHKSQTDKQLKSQEEYLDRNNDSKDKS